MEPASAIRGAVGRLGAPQNMALGLRGHLRVRATSSRRVLTPYLVLTGNRARPTHARAAVIRLNRGLSGGNRHCAPLACPENDATGRNRGRGTRRRLWALENCLPFIQRKATRPVAANCALGRVRPPFGNGSGLGENSGQSAFKARNFSSVGIITLGVLEVDFGAALICWDSQFSRHGMSMCAGSDHFVTFYLPRSVTPGGAGSASFEF